ncbi:MAG: RNA polymerase sigma factor [Phycisphaerales bacterium]
MADRDVTRTTTELLNALHDASDDAAWLRFDVRYRPIIVGFARSLGCDEADAADVAQETLTRFVREYREGKYERERGRLRSWLLTIARYRVLDLRRHAARHPAMAAGTAIVNLEDEAELTVLWDREQRSAMLREALGQLRETRTNEKTITAFELLVIQQQAAADVAEALDMTRHDVYVAKSRVTERLRGIMEELEAAYADVATE